MRAVRYEAFGERPSVVELPDPTPPPDGVVIEVRATGVCRSDWHGWMGHDPDITLPHVPGHEFAGVVAAVGGEVRAVSVGDRVTAPFVCGCGSCAYCLAGDHQVCPDQTQPGFTHWGSFARYVVVHHADVNVVRLPESLSFTAAASLGCRFATSFRAVVDVGRVGPGDWGAVHGCGGVGLSAVMIGVAMGARVVAVDVSAPALELARSLGAEACVDASSVDDVVGEVVEVTGGGAHASLDALGSPVTLANSVSGLRRRGRHVQVGLLAGSDAATPLPMDRVIGWELEILGSHGMPAHRYAAMWEMITSGRLDPSRLVGQEISLDESVDALAAMGTGSPTGVTVVTSF